MSEREELGGVQTHAVIFGCQRAIGNFVEQDLECALILPIDRHLENPRDEYCCCPGKISREFLLENHGFDDTESPTHDELWHAAS
jgi:hypothetical protein